MFLIALVLVGWACKNRHYPEVIVTFDDAGVEPREDGSVSRGKEKLRISVSAMQSPQNTFAAYSPLIERLGALLDVEVELVQRRTYGEINDLLSAGGVAMAFVCTGSYLDLERRTPGAVELAAIPVIGGKLTYQSLIIVPNRSTSRRVEDLEGKRFAFTDRLSLTGRAYPTHYLKLIGKSPESFFASVILTHSHDRSIHAVAAGMVDGAAVDSLIYDYLVHDDVALAREVRVIHRSPDFGMPPVVISASLGAARKAKIRAVLLTLDRDHDAAPALRALHIDRFVAPPAGLYTTAAEVMAGDE